MTADEAKQAIKEGQIWYQRYYNYLVLIRAPVQSESPLWFILFDNDTLELLSEDFIRGLEYIGELI